MEIWDMMINITRERANKAFREMDFERIKTAYGKGDKTNV